MALPLDTTKLQAAARKKVRYIDNCSVVDAGTGSFPREIVVQVPGDDGEQLIAINNTIFGLTTSHEVRISVSAANPVAIVEGFGTGTSGNLIDNVAVSKLVSPDGNTDPVLAADNNGDLAATGRLSLGGAAAGGQILDVEGDDTNLIFRLANTKAASTANSAELTLAVKTSTSQRTVIGLDASFDNTTDASRNSLVVIRTADGGTFGDTITIDGIDVTFGADILAGGTARGIIETPAWFDFTLVDSSEGDHFRQNTAALPTGWSSGTDPDIRFGTHLHYSFYRADSSQSLAGWDMSKQTGINLESLASNFWMSWQFGPVLFRDGGFTEDVDYYFAIHGDDSGSPGTLDADIYTRVHLQWDSAGSQWRVRGEEKDGSTAHNGSWSVFGLPINQPLWFRVVVRNTATKETRNYLGTTYLPSTHTNLQSQNPTSAPTWGTVHLKVHMTRGLGVQDRLLIGAVDYLGDES